jgi:hypothetical protein
MKVFIVISLLFIQLVSFCQTSQAFGYIVSNQGDTIVGLIDIQTNNQNSRSCIYRANEESKSKKYLPSEIKAFGLDNGSVYLSKQIDFNGEVGYYFLEYLVNGNVNLYYLEEQNLGYYYIEKDSIFTQLSKNDKVIVNEGREYLLENKYKGVLSYLYRDSPDMQSSIQNTTFTHKSLINVTKEYNTNMCPDEECIVYKKSTKTRIALEPTFGLKYSELTFDYDYEPNLKPVIGFLIKFFPAKYNNYFSINTGFVISSNNYKSIYKHLNYSYNTYIADHDVSVKFNSLKLPIEFEFTFKAGRFQPQIELGFENIFLLNTFYKINTTTSDINDISSSVNFYSAYQAFNLGLGGKFNVNNKSYISGKICYEYGLTPFVGYGTYMEGFIKNSYIVTISYGIQLTK